jgi:hypothetical protein
MPRPSHSSHFNPASHRIVGWADPTAILDVSGVWTFLRTLSVGHLRVAKSIVYQKQKTTSAQISTSHVSIVLTCKVGVAWRELAEIY